MRFVHLKAFTLVVFAMALVAMLTFTRSAMAYPSGITSDAWHDPPGPPPKNPALGCSQSNGCHTGGGDEAPSVFLSPAPGSGGNPVLLTSTWFVDPDTTITFRFTNSTTKGNEQHKGFNIADTGSNYGTLSAAGGAGDTEVQQLDGYLGRKEVTHKSPAKTGSSVSWDFHWRSPGACTPASLTGWGNAVKAGTYTFNGASGITINIKTRCNNDGSACTNDVHCVSGACTDGVCCNRRCGAECETCVGSPVGTCTNRPSGPPRPGAPKFGDCGGSGVCAGSCQSFSSTCVFPTVKCRDPVCASDAATPAGFCSAGSCPLAPAPTACAPYACFGSVCGGACSDDSGCIAGNWCATDGTCKPKGTDGTACGTAHECNSNFCVDGVCCNNACGGQCSTCSGATKGTCSPVVGAPTGGRPACATDGVSSCGGACDGVGLAGCKYPVTECRPADCTGGVETLAANCDGFGSCPIAKAKSCAPFACGAAGCATTCTIDSECGTAFYCAGGTCTPKSIVGDGCLTDAACTTGQCVDGVCCNTVCSGQCEACDVGGKVGTCVNVSDAPHGKRAACAAGTDGCATACDGTNPLVCSPASCDAGADAAPDAGGDGSTATDADEAGSGDAGGEGGPSDALTLPDANKPDTTSEPGVDEPNENASCACRTTDRPRAPYGGFALFGLGLGALVLRQRRRRSIH